MKLALWLLALFVAAFLLNTRHNRFPYYYHPDEPGKVEQVLEGNWNLHHPLLLLGTTKAAARITGAKTEQQVVELGRTLSAFFIAAAVAALSLLAYAWRGWPAALVGGALLVTHHQLYELSHYFKEDSALLCGVALTLLALWLHAKAPSPGRAACLGLACALAISGKYLGVMMLALALPVLVAGRKPRHVLAFAGAFVAGLLVVNWPMLLHLDTFRASFARETNLVIAGQGGTTRSVPHAEYWTIFRDNTTPLIWAALLVFLVARWRERRALTLAAWLIVAFPFVYAFALSFSPKTNDRYFLPASAVFTIFAALGVCDFPRRWLTLAGGLLVAAQFPSWSKSRPGWLEYERAFRHDDNAELIDFLRREVPPDAVLLKDNRIALPDPERKKHAARLGVIPQKVIARRYAADFAPFDELRAQGVTHVLVSESDYGRYFRRSLRPQEGAESQFARSRQFYERLFAEGELLWQRERGTVIYLHPGIRVYRLR
jgi:hypothetical protein